MSLWSRQSIAVKLPVTLVLLLLAAFGAMAVRRIPRCARRWWRLPPNASSASRSTPGAEGKVAEGATFYVSLPANP